MRLINFSVFILSFLFGMIYIYFTNPTPNKIIVYPTNDNRHLFQFRDKVNNYFQLTQNKVECSNQFEEIPIQI
jgi:hypothetical protein